MTNLKKTISDALHTRFGEKFAVPDGIDGLTTLNTMASHRTYRRYSDQPVDEELRRLIFGCALSAPSKSDLQQADIIEVCDPVLRDSIADLLPSMPWVGAAPVFVVVCGSGARIRQISAHHDIEFGNDHLDAFFNSTVDAALVLSHLMVAAEAVGLGTCPISVIRDYAQTVSDLLELPDHVFPVAGLCIGWPAEQRRISARIPTALTIQRDTYSETDWQSHVDTYDARRGRLDGWDPNDANFRGWSLQKAMMYERPQRVEFGDFVRKRGYCLD